MALNRNDSCRHFMNGEAFAKCLCYYSADHAGQANSWEVVTLAADMPEGQQADPTDAQINAVADVAAMALYNAWVASVDAETVVEETHTGVGGSVVA